MDDKTVEQLLDTVADYAERVDQAGRLEQEGSMAAAFALDELYENGAWVDEWLEQSPPPKTNVRNWQADSRNRFTKWVEWREEQRKRKSVGNRYAYNLMAAAEIARDLKLSPAQVKTERQLRPLKNLITKKRRDRIPEVWAIAVEIAGTATSVTGDIVLAARKQWEREVLGGNSTGKTPTAKDRRARQVEAWRRKHLEAVNSLAQLADDALRDKDAWAEFEEAWLEIKQLVRETADRARAGAA